MWALLLEDAFPHLATDVIYVAGDRVVTDALCKPFSMGRNLFCVHSKVRAAGGSYGVWAGGGWRLWSVCGRRVAGSAGAKWRFAELRGGLAGGGSSTREREGSRQLWEGAACL